MLVYNSDFDHVYTVTRYKHMELTLRYVGNSVLTLLFDTDDDAVHFLKRNNFIIAADQPFIVRHVQQKSDTVEVTAFGGHKLLEMRITGSGTKKNREIVKTGSPDAVAKHFVDQCKGDLPITTAAPTAGTNISDQTRLKVLGDEVARILLGAGRGEWFTLDDINKTIVFDTYAGDDKSINNTDDNPPVLFSLEMHNINELEYTENATDDQTTIYVGGAGEGVKREIVIVGGAATGLDRVERFKDARDVEEGDTDKLTERGQQEIINTLKTISTTAIADSGLVYGVDYFLGDIVTTRVKHKTYEQQGDFFNPVEEILQVDQRITEVVITRQGGAEYIDLRFGDEPITPDSSTSAGRQIAQLATTEPAVNPSGWIAAREEWTRKSNYSFEISGDKRSKYQPRDKFKVTQGGTVKYGWFTGVSYSGGKTTVTTSLDTILTNTAIDDPAYSRADRPHGFNLYGALLWDGAGSAGIVITVPGLQEYRKYMIVLTGLGTYLDAYLNISNTLLRGNAANPTGTIGSQIHLVFTADVSGDQITLDRMDGITHTASGSHTSKTDRTLAQIYGMD